MFSIIKIIFLLWQIDLIQSKLKGNEDILDYLKALPKIHEKRYANINKCQWWDSATCESLSTTHDSLEYKYIQKLLPENWCGWGKAICRN